MNLSPADPREQKLAAAWDESREPYALTDTLTIRPFSLAALRRAERLDSRLVKMGFAAVKKYLPPRERLAELDKLAWLLAAPLPDVQRALRSEAIPVPLGSVLSPADRAPFAAEIRRVLALLHAAMFTTEPKPEKPGSALDSTDEPSPPASLVSPGVYTSLLYGVAEKIRVDPIDLSEHWPACQSLQMIHCLQWGNPDVWTVDPSTPKAEQADPWKGQQPEPDEGFGVEVEF